MSMSAQRRVWGLDRGYCLMIGGPDEAVQHLDSIFATLAPRADAARLPRTRAAGTAPFGYLHCGPSGAGHFVKMVHNGNRIRRHGRLCRRHEHPQGRNAGKVKREADAETSPLQNPNITSSTSTSPTSPRSGGLAASSAHGCSTSPASTLKSDASLANFGGSRLGFRRRPLDAEGGDRPPACRHRAVLRAVRPLLLARRIRIRRQAVVRHALCVRRPCREAEGRLVTAAGRHAHEPGTVRHAGAFRRHRRPRPQEDISSALTQNGRQGYAHRTGDRRRVRCLGFEAVAGACPRRHRPCARHRSTKKFSPSSRPCFAMSAVTIANPATFERLKGALGKRPAALHYMAVPPTMFETTSRGWSNRARRMARG